MPMTIPHCLRNRAPRSKPNYSAFAFAHTGGKIHYEFHCHCSLARKAERAASAPRGNARGKSEYSLLCREYCWTLGVVDRETICPSCVCSFHRMRLGARSMDELEDADESSN